MKTLIKSVTIATLSLGLISLSSIAGETPLKPIKEVFEPAAPADASKYMKVAVIQWNPEGVAPVGGTKADADSYMKSNRDEMAARIRTAAAKNAKYIVLSEFAVVGYPDIPELPSEDDNYRNREDAKNFVDTVPGVSTAYFSKVAKSLKVWVQFGMMEVDAITKKYYNVAVVINDQGIVVAKHRKVHLFEIEVNYLEAGLTPTVFLSPMGKIGLIICSDVYDYDLLGQYKKLGIDVLSLSTSWAQMNSGMGMFKSAATSVGVMLLAANQTYYPDSGVINKNGTTQSHIRQAGDAIAYGYVPLKK